MKFTSILLVAVACGKLNINSISHGENISISKKTDKHIPATNPITAQIFDTTNPLCVDPVTETTKANVLPYKDCYKAWLNANWTQPLSYDKCDPTAETWNAHYGSYGKCQLWATSAFGKADCMHLPVVKEAVRHMMFNCSRNGLLDVNSYVWWPDREKGGQYFYVQKA